MTSVAKECGACKKYSRVELKERSALVCAHCQSQWPSIPLTFSFESCPFCQCRQFYTQKDFNQGIGCLIMAVGIVLVPLTYGLSLPVFALFDWLLFKKVQEAVVCYRCGGEFRGFLIPAHFKNFMHHIGEKYERQEEAKSS